jgi:hypothetical protein
LNKEINDARRNYDNLALLPSDPWRKPRMRLALIVLLLPLALGGCLSFSSSNPPPPARDTVVVPPGSAVVH